MDVSDVVQKLKRQRKEQDKKQEQARKQLKSIKQQLLTNAKKIQVKNNQELDDYLNKKIQESIHQNVYTFSLENKDFKDFYSILHVNNILGEDLLAQYKDMHGSNFDLYSRVNKIMLKKIVKYINQNSYYHAVLMPISYNNYELTVYIDF